MSFKDYGKYFSLSLSLAGVIVIISLFVKLGSKNYEPQRLCWNDTFDGTQICKMLCNNGSFSLPNMVYCHSWLTCEDIVHNIKVKQLIAEGVVKKVFLASWNGYDVVYSELTDPQFKDDFQNQVMMLKSLSSESDVIQYVGSCEDTIVTEYHKLGDARNFHEIFRQKMGSLANIATRFSMCINYVKILAFLHSSPIGTRVMCDSNNLKKTLSQFLLRQDMALIINDLDALPEVRKVQGDGVKCGHKQLFGDFVAPEQKWQHKDREFSDEEMPFYDEMSDIWKIPNVCAWFLGEDKDSELVQFHLYKLHKQCKSVIPHLRPTSKEILKQYQIIWNKINKFAK